MESVWKNRDTREGKDRTDAVILRRLRGDKFKEERSGAISPLRELIL